MRKVEAAIEELETNIRELETQLGQEEYYNDPEKLQELNGVYLDQKEELQKKSTNWEDLVEEITRLENP